MCKIVLFNANFSILQLFVLFLISCPGIRGQKLNFVNYSIEQGLIQSQAQHIAQDAYGYLWVSTLGGLSRFNGSRFVNYTRRNGLQSQIVNVVLHQEGHGLWVGSQNSLQLYDGRNFTNYSWENGGTRPNIRRLSPLGTGRVLALATNGKLFKAEDGKLKLLEAYSSVGFTDIAQDRNGIVYGLSNSVIYNLTSGTPTCSRRTCARRRSATWRSAH